MYAHCRSLECSSEGLMILMSASWNRSNHNRSTKGTRENGKVAKLSHVDLFLLIILIPQRASVSLIDYNRAADWLDLDFIIRGSVKGCFLVKPWMDGTKLLKCFQECVWCLRQHFTFGRKCNVAILVLMVCMSLSRSLRSLVRTSERYGAFRKRSSNRRNLKTPVFCFLVEWTKTMNNETLFQNEDVTIIDVIVYPRPSFPQTQIQND